MENKVYLFSVKKKNNVLSRQRKFFCEIRYCRNHLLFFSQHTKFLIEMNCCNVGKNIIYLRKTSFHDTTNTDIMRTAPYSFCNLHKCMLYCCFLEPNYICWINKHFAPLLCLYLFVKLDPSKPAFNYSYVSTGLLGYSLHRGVSLAMVTSLDWHFE